MLRSFIRCQLIVHEPKITNLYKGTSGFNVKQVRTPGIVYNPPHAIKGPSLKTPKAFLPKNDPRKTLPEKTYTPEELADYPLIQEYKLLNERVYDVTAETAQEIKQLRHSDPKEWTISKLSKKFNIPPYKILRFAGPIEKPKEEIPEVWTRQLGVKLDREKRRKMWQRNEY